MTQVIARAPYVNYIKKKKLLADYIVTFGREILRERAPLAETRQYTKEEKCQIFERKETHESSSSYTQVRYMTIDLLIRE